MKKSIRYFVFFFFFEGGVRWLPAGLMMKSWNFLPRMITNGLY